MKHLLPEDLTDSEKNYVWSNVTPHLRAQAKTTPFFASFWRKAIAFTLVASIVMGGGLATASAHYDVVPGDFLFPVEVATEKVQIFLAGSSTSKESLRIKFAEKRLVEVKTLIKLSKAAADTKAAVTSSVAGATATSTTQAITTTTSASPATTTIYLSKGAMKQIARTERAIAIALGELEETRSMLASAGSQSGVFIIDDIIEELRGAGDGTVTITKIAAKGNSGKVSIKATFTPTGWATTSNSFSGTVKIEETKRGTRITMNDTEVKTSITVRATNTPDKARHGNKDDDEDVGGDDHDRYDKRGKDDDGEDDDHDDERDNKGKNHNKKKTKVCHRSDNERHTIEISLSAARAHLAHGDTLGACQTGGGTGTTTPDTTNPAFSDVTVSAGTSTVTLDWKTNEPTRARIYVSTVSPVSAVTPNTEFADLTLTRATTLRGLSTSTTYYFLISVSDAAGNRATTSQGSFVTGSGIPPVTVDTTTPTIAGIAFTPSTTGVGVTWITDEAAKTRVWLRATSSPDVSLAPTQEESGMATSHSMNLSALMPATVYRVILSAVDAAGNRGTSTERSFTTSALPAPADVTAPTVSGIEKSVATTTALITWNTNEAAGTVFYFGTGIPALGTALSNNTMLLAHDASLSGLTGSTTYRFLIVSKDSAGNTATTSESTLTTL